MKNTTKLTIFSTALLTAVIFILYMMLLADINTEMLNNGIDYAYPYLSPGFVIVLIFTAAVAYVVTSLMIDQILNPIRLMIAKIKEVEKMDFTAPLVISSGEDELKEYAYAFNHMTRTVSGYIERQRRFISDASHELTTPLTVINGHTDMLLRRWKTQPELLDDGLAVIRAEALRMSELVDSLLLLARGDSGKQAYNFERQDISALIHESAEETRLIAENFTVTAEIREGLTVLCDEYAIRRVLRIILSNAVKYAGSCHIKSYASHGLAYMQISDDGNGIAPEHLPHIFDRFYRADTSRAKKTGSSGLGLAIARELARAHGGDITAESEAGKGAVFTVVLPINA